MCMYNCKCLKVIYACTVLCYKLCLVFRRGNIPFIILSLYFRYLRHGMSMFSKSLSFELVFLQNQAFIGMPTIKKRSRFSLN